MLNKKADRFDLLRSMLAVLVDEWGVGAVSSELERIRAGRSEASLIGDHPVCEPVQEKHGIRSSKRPTAVMLASKISLPSGQKQLIEMLAEKFDNKKFLPTLGDIKYFFEMHGEAIPSSKQRIECFRKVLRLLSSLPESALKKMIDEDAHSGPSSLAPLSEAMRAVGAERSGMLEQSQLSSEPESPKELPEKGAASSDV